MKGLNRYYKALRNPESLEALSDSYVLPKELVHYSMALQEVEKQVFPNIHSSSKDPYFSNLLSFHRIIRPSYYEQRCKSDPKIYEAEVQRQKARIALNDAMINDYVKSYIFRYEDNEELSDKPDELDASFWRSSKAFNIDNLSLYYGHFPNGKIRTVGVIALHRSSLEKWGRAYPNPPNIRGRKRGAGVINDDHRINLMHDQIKKNGISPNKAASIVVDDFGITGASRDADVDRLGRKYRQKYPN